MQREHRILVIDDDKAFTEIFSQVLASEGYSVEVAYSSEEALEVLKDDFFGLIIIDIGLPGMDGLELITKINKTDPDMRKIILTGNSSMENITKALKGGAHEYLTKPVQIEEVKDVLRKQLEILDTELREKYKTLA